MKNSTGKSHTLSKSQLNLKTLHTWYFCVPGTNRMGPWDRDRTQPYEYYDIVLKAYLFFIWIHLMPGRPAVPAVPDLVSVTGPSAPPLAPSLSQRLIFDLQDNFADRGQVALACGAFRGDGGVPTLQEGA